VFACDKFDDVAAPLSGEAICALPYGIYDVKNRYWCNRAGLEPASP